MPTHLSPSRTTNVHFFYLANTGCARDEARVGEKRKHVQCEMPGLHVHKECDEQHKSFKCHITAKPEDGSGAYNPKSKQSVHLASTCSVQQALPTTLQVTLSRESS